jgi:hypothetical protein
MMQPILIHALYLVDLARGADQGTRDGAWLGRRAGFPFAAEINAWGIVLGPS